VTADRYVLVVDDYPDAREMLATYLAFRGFAVATADDGASAIRKALTERPGLILMDLSMPGVDGWEATRRLRADARTKDVPIIAVTAHAGPDSEAKAREAGVDGFIAKPFDLDALANVVEDFVRT
jgi:two-component system, cell cycle response regulator DivK